MYQVQYTEYAHTTVPDHCWLDGSRHRLLSRAFAGERRYRLSAPLRSWANNTRIIDEATGDPITQEQRMEHWITEHLAARD